MPVLIWPRDAAVLLESIRAGGVFAAPSEAVFGLSGHAGQADALQGILDLKKGRAAAQGVLLVAGSAAVAQGYVVGISERDWREMAAAQTARATTFLLPAGDKVATGAVVNGKVALRPTRHALLAAVSNAVGAPLFSTSANPHGLPPARSAEEVLRYFPGLCVLDGALGGEEKPSRIVDWASGAVIRD